MNAKMLQAEIEEALLRGAELMFKSKGDTGMIDIADVRVLMKERAANLAAGLASRTLSDRVRDKLPQPGEPYATDLIEEVILDLEG
jgi:hypothetical protein